MFSQLTNFGYERTGKQALGFYLAYLLLVLLVGGIAGGIAGVITGGEDHEFLMRVGGGIAILVCLLLAVLVVSAKGLWSSFLALLLVLAAGGLAAVLGALLGLIPVAYLSTVKSKNAEANIQTL